MAYTVMEVLFSIGVKLLLLGLDYWGENIERMFCDDNVCLLIYGSVCLAATEGTCSDV